MGLVEGFTQKYDIKVPVYFEETTSVEAATSRERQLKGWRRAGKLELIEKENPEWKDLAEDLF